MSIWAINRLAVKNFVGRVAQARVRVGNKTLTLTTRDINISIQEWALD